MTTSSNTGQGLIFYLKGPLTAENAEAVRDQIAEAYNTNSNGDLILEMGGVDFLDSMGIGALVSLSRLAGQRGRSLRLCAVQPSPRMVLEITRIDQLIPIFPSVTAAEMVAS